MDQIQNINISLQTIVKNIDNGEYVIPKFQRGFVWNITDVESLGDSIVRGYPIGSLLTMEVAGTLDIEYTPIKTHNASVAKENKNYLLDGQQRITAIAKIFLGLDNKKEYYFDLLSILDDKFPEDDIGNDIGIKEKLKNNNNQFSPISNYLCRSFGITKEGDVRETRQHNRFISGRGIIENRFGSIISKFIRIFQDKTDEELDKYIDYLSAVLGSMSGYDILVTNISKDSDLDLVVRVFEKVNTTGIKLTLIDLVNAKSFKTTNIRYKNGFADYIKDYLELYTHNNGLSKEIFNNYLGYDNKIDNYSNLSRVVRTIIIAESLCLGHQSKLTNKYMLSKDADFWFEMWDRYKSQLLLFYTWLEQEGMTNIGNMTFYEYIGAIVAEYPELATNKIFLKEIKKYALYITISKKGFNRSDLEVFNKFTEFAKHILNAHQFDKYKFDKLPKTPINFTVQDVIETRGRNNSSEAIKHIMYTENSKGLCSVDLCGNTIKYPLKNDIDEHHIIAKSLTKQERKSIYGSIANVTFLDKNANRIDIKDKNINVYMEELKHILGDDRFKFVLKQNLLSEFYKNPNISEIELLTSRAQKIAALINSFFN